MMMHPPMRKNSSSTTTTQNSYSPSFTSYFNTNLADIAVRVTSEFTDVDDDDKDDAFLIQCLEEETEAPSSSRNTRTQITSSEQQQSNNSKSEVDDEEELESSEFEFDLANLAPPNEDLGPVYPVFNRDLFHGSYDPQVVPAETDSTTTSKVQIQLKSLFLGEDDHRLVHNDDLPPSPTLAGSSSSSSSSDSDAGEDLDSIPPGTYCVWTPNNNKSSPPPPIPSGCTKSNSTGSTSAAASSSSSAMGKTKEFRLRDLLRRSKSDGKDGVMLITPMPKQRKPTTTAAAAKGKAVAAAPAGGVRGSPARESFEYHYYRRGRREGESGGGGANARRKSYLPYKQDLVGFFVTPHGLRKIQLPPFS